MPIIARATYPTALPTEPTTGTIEAVYSVRVIPTEVPTGYYLTGITITTDKLQYRPGETMIIKFIFKANTKVPMGYGANYWLYINGKLIESSRIRFYDSDTSTLRKTYNIPTDITTETYITIRIVATKALTYG